MVVALVWANAPWGDAYESVRDARVGPSSLHLDLTLGAVVGVGLRLDVWVWSAFRPRS